MRACRNGSMENKNSDKGSGLSEEKHRSPEYDKNSRNNKNGAEYAATDGQDGAQPTDVNGADGAAQSTESRGQDGAVQQETSEAVGAQPSEERGLKKDSGAEKSTVQPLPPANSADDPFGGEFGSLESSTQIKGKGSANSHTDGQKSEGEQLRGGKKRRFVLWERPQPLPKQKYSRSFMIALSAISCAFAAIFLSLGVLSNVLVATGYIIAEVALMAPLSKRFYLGDFLAYLGTVLLAVLLGALGQFWSLVPFVMFFGLHPMFNAFQLRFKLTRWIALVFKMIWFDATLYVAYLVVFNGVLGAGSDYSAFFDFVNKYIWLFIAVLGSLFLWFYDYVMFKTQVWVNRLVGKIKK